MDYQIIATLGPSSAAPAVWMEMLAAGVTAFRLNTSHLSLEVLVAWLESPVSRKYQQITPDAQQALTQKIVAETRPQIEPKLKALEQTMMAMLKTASAAASPSAPSPSATSPAAPKPADSSSKK